MATQITVWVRQFKGRRYPMLQWMDSETGKRKSQSAGTNDAKGIEQARADKEYELNNGLHDRSGTMTWGRFRELYETEEGTSRSQKGLISIRTCFNRFERHVKMKRIGPITERTLSRLASEMRAEGLVPATI
jgi:hypothetical protein